MGGGREGGDGLCGRPAGEEGLDGWVVPEGEEGFEGGIVGDGDRSAAIL